MSDAERGWSDYWQKDSAEGEVFVTGKGERHPALAEFWQAQFKDLDEGARLIDLASGAGSVFAHLPEGRAFHLYAADISDVALRALQERFPGTSTVVCSADAVPLEDRSFDLVVTQFGVEYAGVAAFAEAARLVAPGGRFVGLCHIRDGYIDSDNRRQLAEAKIVARQEFIDHAIRLITAAYSGDPATLRYAQNAFAAAATPVGEGMRRCRKGIHTYLFQGFRKLYEGCQQYDLADITGWLEAMRGELEVNLDRLGRMCDAALSEADVREIERIFENQCLIEVHCTPFRPQENELPIAWQVMARREK
jgi:ubiquinone/menaquinone biosynthesis C-methylase UbiE